MSTSSQEEHILDMVNKKRSTTPDEKLVVYRECLKNHAASIGGNATDGCGEFMAAGDGGTPESLKCSACNCHRNFHRKYQIQAVGGGQYHHSADQPELLLGYPTGMVISSTCRAAPRQMIMPRPYKAGGLIIGRSEANHDDQDQDEAGTTTVKETRKRFRTKFSQEQKEKMLAFAERVGWKIQEVEESVVQNLCQEIGVKRRVLKVWMHNNKHTLTPNRNNTTTSAS